MPKDTRAVEIMEKINRSVADRTALEQRWMNYYKLYRNWRDQQQISGRSNVGIPLAFEWVEVVKSRLFDIFFGKRPYVRVKGREPMDDLPARLVQEYQNYQYDLADYRKLGYDILTQVLIYGTGIAKVWWKYDEKEKHVRVPIFPELPQAGTEWQKMNVPVYDNICFELVDIFDFFIDPEATSIQDAEWVAHRVRRSPEYLKKMEKLGIYHNVDSVIEELAREQLYGGSEPNQHKQERLTIEGHMADKNLMMKQCELYEFSTGDEIIAICKDKIIREQENPNRNGKKGYVEAKIISTPHEFYGIGLIEAGAPSAKVMEDLLNNGLDSLNFSINPMIGVDQTRVEDTELVSRPGGTIHTTGDPRTAINPFLIPNVSPEVLTFINLMNEFAKKGTGVVDYMLGQVTSGKTATEASLLTNEAAKRIGMHIKVFGLTFVGKLAEMVYELTGQYTTQEQTIRVTAMAGTPYETVNITPDTYGAIVDFIWEAEDRELNNMVSIQQLMQVLAIVKTDPVLQQFAPIVFEKILEKYDMHENEELKQAAKAAKQLAPLYQQLVMQQMATQIQNASVAAAAKGGIANSPRVAGGTANNISQSLQTQANPSLGNSPV